MNVYFVCPSRRAFLPLAKIAAGTLLALCVSLAVGVRASAQEPPTATVEPTATSTPSPVPTDTATPRPTQTRVPTLTPTPIPTNTPTVTPTPLPPLPSLEQLQFLTPTPTDIPESTATPDATSTAPASPQPPAAPYEPEREPVRAEVAEAKEEAAKGPIETPTPTPQPPAAAVADSPPALKATLTPLNVSNGQTPQPPLSLTPAGIAQGGPGSESSSLPQGTLVTVGALLLAAGGSWGAYYFLRPPAD